jgi:hypothetical protein
MRGFVIKAFFMHAAFVASVGTERFRFRRHGRLTALALFSALVVASCGGGDDEAPPAAVPPPAERSVGSLRLIGQQVLPRRSDYSGTVVGGLSGIDYDAANRRYVLISDDRTTTDSPNPPRMYFANLTFDATTFSSVQFTSTFSMKQPNGSDYPKVPDPAVADPEGVRVDPVSGNLLWISEGDRTLTSTPPRVINPFVREVRPDGTHVREYALPAMFQMSAQDTGPRGNAVFEGVAFTPDRSKTFIMTEGPLFQDGPLPTTTTGSVTRLTVFDRERGTATAQYAYPLDRVQTEPQPAGQFTVNGATEILAVTNTRFLVLERSFSVGVVGNQVRLYEIDVSNATNVLNTAALAGASYTAVTKRLVLDFETLKTQLGGIANLEGITFGPKLANGRDSIVVVADDNFPLADSTTDRNQFLVFEVIPQ